jgi:hypothetical protein
MARQLKGLMQLTVLGTRRKVLRLGRSPCGKALPYRYAFKRFEATPQLLRRSLKMNGGPVGKAEPFRTECGKAAEEGRAFPRGLRQSRGGNANLSAQTGGKAAGEREPLRTGCVQSRANLRFSWLIQLFWLLNGGPQQTAKDTLDADLIGGQGKRLQLRIGGMQLHVDAAPVKSFQRRLILFDEERNNNFAVARVGTIFDQSDVAVTDVLVDHRIAFNLQSINSFGSHAAEQEARHRHCLVTFNYIEWRAGGNAPQKFHFTKRVGIVNRHVERERSIFMFACQQSTTFKRCDMFCDGGSRLHAKVPRDLSV